MRLLRSRDDDWESRVHKVLREGRPELDDSSWVPMARLQQDLGFDSLALVAMALRLEEELRIDPMALMDRADSINTVADLMGAVDALRQPVSGRR